MAVPAAYLFPISQAQAPFAPMPCPIFATSKKHEQKRKSTSGYERRYRQYRSRIDAS